MRSKTVLALMIALVAAVVLALLTAGCGPSSGSKTSAKQDVHSAVANPSVQADEQAAAKLVQSCVTSSNLTAAKQCIANKIPPAHRAALKTCLASAAASATAHPGHVKVTFEAGAQTCVAKALAS